jgi:hypothetical protein
LRDNIAGEGGGGAVYCGSASPRLIRCTLAGNAGTDGGGLISYGDCFPELEQTIIAFCTEGCAIYCNPGGQPTLTCCNLYGNADGDWIGCIADQHGVAGNIGLDPLFCPNQSPESVLELQDESPCAPFSPPNAQCDLIGAGEVGCTSAHAPGSAAVPGYVYLSRPAPSPFSEVTTFTYALTDRDSGAHVRVAIRDVTGRCVRTLVNESSAPGVHRISWDGRDQAGNRAQAGIYYCELRAAHEVVVRRALVVR